jgi:hypothetical protein
MITCKQCGNEFLPIWREGYPGGAETCGTIVVRAFGLFVVGAFFCAVGFYSTLNVFYFFGTLFVLMSWLKIASIPENRQVILNHRGNECPNCGASNELSWYH